MHIHNTMSRTFNKHLMCKPSLVFENQPLLHPWPLRNRDHNYYKIYPIPESRYVPFSRGPRVRNYTTRTIATLLLLCLHLTSLPSAKFAMYFYDRSLIIY